MSRARQRQNFRFWRQVPSDLHIYGTIQFEAPTPLQLPLSDGKVPVACLLHWFFDGRQPKRDIQSVIPSTCLGAGRAVRKGDTELSVRPGFASLAARRDEDQPCGLGCFCTCGPTTSTRTPRHLEICPPHRPPNRRAYRGASCWCTPCTG